LSLWDVANFTSEKETKKINYEKERSKKLAT
jgi:hypothetical protein